MFESFDEYLRSLEEINKDSKPEKERCITCGAEIDEYNPKCDWIHCSDCVNSE